MDSLFFRIYKQYEPKFDEIRSKLISDAEAKGTLGWTQKPNSPKVYFFDVRNYRVTIKETFIKFEGSICSFMFGSNLNSMTKALVTEAISELESELGIDLHDAHVCRFDIAHNLIMEKPAMSYISLLECKRLYRTIEEKNGTYFRNDTRCYFFYDKGAESSKAITQSPGYNCLDGLNILRYESRYGKSTYKSLGVRGQLRIRDIIYSDVLDRANSDWVVGFFAIAKNMDYKLPKMVNDLKEFKQLACALGASSDLGGYEGMTRILERSIDLGAFEQPMQRTRAREWITEINDQPNLHKENPLIGELRNGILSAAVYFSSQ